MGVYRIHDSGLWSGLSETQQIEGVIEFYEQMNANLKFQYDNTIRTLIAKDYQDLARAYEKIGDFEKVQGCIQRSLAAIG